jgi:hypothetical protein
LTQRLHETNDDRQSGATGGSSHRLAEKGDDIEAAQGREHGLKDLCPDNPTYRSGNRVSGAEIVAPLK